MKIVPGIARLDAPPRAAVVAIGNFDGVHLGHQHILRTAVEHARARGGEAVVLTFDPHPAKVLAPERAPPLLTTRDRKLAVIGRLGLDLAVVEPFDRPFSQLEPDVFLRDQILAHLAPREVCVGYDFRFGHERRGDVPLMTRVLGAAGVAVTVFDPVSTVVDGVETAVRSTEIRAALSQGRVRAATAMLGRDFVVDGTVVRGAGRGQGLGFPTANVAPETEAMPGLGIYAGWVEAPAVLGARRVAAAISVGRNPTFGAGGPVTLEAFLLDFEGNLYGARVTVGFAERLRDERRFESPAALAAQIEIDVRRTREILGGRQA